MKILVSDTSVLIDLERGGLLDSCFQLPFELAVPDLLYTRELKDFGGPALVERGLRVEELSGDEVTAAQTVRAAHRKLSLPDAFAYALAAVRGWTLLTGDGELRTLAEAQGVPFFGVLWVLDQLFDGQVIEANVIASGLEAIEAHPRCRLPRAEIRVRIEKYRNR
jgi:predicted nucleic acid-binding protein